MEFFGVGKNEVLSPWIFQRFVCKFFHVEKTENFKLLIESHWWCNLGKKLNEKSLNKLLPSNFSFTTLNWPHLIRLEFSPNFILPEKYFSHAMNADGIIDFFVMSARYQKANDLFWFHKEQRMTFYSEFYRHEETENRRISAINHHYYRWPFLLCGNFCPLLSLFFLAANVFFFFFTINFYDECPFIEKGQQINFNYVNLKDTLRGDEIKWWSMMVFVWLLVVLLWGSCLCGNLLEFFFLKSNLKNFSQKFSETFH